MSGFKAFLARKNIVFSAKRYGVDALGAMAQGLFCTLLVGTILNTLGTQLGVGFLSATVVTVGSGDAAVGYTIGGLASAMVGPAMAIAIGYALQAPPLVLFSLAPVGYATNVLGGAGGPLAVLVVTVVAAELGKLVSKETKVDILVTPFVTIFVGVGLSSLVAPAIGSAASATSPDRAAAALSLKRTEKAAAASTKTGIGSTSVTAAGTRRFAVSRMPKSSSGNSAAQKLRAVNAAMISAARSVSCILSSTRCATPNSTSTETAASKISPIDTPHTPFFLPCHFSRRARIYAREYKCEGAVKPKIFAEEPFFGLQRTQGGEKVFSTSRSPRFRFAE